MGNAKLSGTDADAKLGNKREVDRFKEPIGGVMAGALRL